MAKEIKIVLTKVGTVYDPAYAYRLHDYIVVEDVTMYVCKRVDAKTMTNVGHELTETDWWDRAVDLGDALKKAQEALDTASTTNATLTENEEARKTAEQARVDAESKRASYFSAMRDNAVKATAAANAAATNANAATTAANAATSKANTASDEASKVNATITDENVMEVTDRTGAKKTLSLVSEAKAEELSKTVSRHEQALGSYTDRADIKLTPSQTNKAISKDGVLVAKSGWAIAEFTAEKGNEYLFKPNTIDGSVCIFAERVDKVEKRSIDYDFEYNEDGQITKATATYLGKTHTYTYEYTADESGNTSTVITETGVGTVESLPYQYTTTVGSYSPLVRLNEGAELPKDGYCRFMSHFKGNGALKVVVSYKVGTADLTMKVLRDGVFSSISTQLGNLSQKENETRNLAVELSEQFKQFVDSNPYVGMVRMNGDMSCDAEKNLGDSSLMHEVGAEWKLATVKNGKITHIMAPCRLTLDEDGNEVKIDGSEGDVMLINKNAYLLRGAKTIDGREMNVVGIGKKPSSWYGIDSKRLPPFGMTPCETVNAKLFDDVRSQAHCVYNKKAIGTYNTINWPLFKETYKKNGGGYSHTALNAFNSIVSAQDKNEERGTAYPYMGWYYETYEALLATLYSEFGSLYVEGAENLGSGCCKYAPTERNWNDDAISGNAGMKVIRTDGSAYYTTLLDQAVNVASGLKNYYICGVSRGQYDFVEMLEEQRLLDGIAKANLIDMIGSKENVFSYDEDGNVVCTSDGSINLDTGDGMTPTKFYYLVRNIPQCEGMADGVMTAVVNRYVKLEFNDGYTSISSKSLDGAIGLMKISLPVYRGFSLPMRGVFRQMSYAYYMINNDKEGNISTDYMCYSKMENVKPLPATYNDNWYKTSDGTLPLMVKGMKKAKKAIYKGNTNELWASKSDYNTSLFCYTKGSGGNKVYENAYLWLYSSNYSGVGSSIVHGSVVGCAAFVSRASARSADCGAGANGSGYYAGAFAVRLEQEQ